MGVILLQFFFIYYLTSRQISPTLRISNKKLYGDIAYTSAVNSESVQLEVMNSKSGKVTTTSWQFETSGRPTSLLWSPNGRRVIVSVPQKLDNNLNFYYDTQTSNLILIPIDNPQDKTVVGWLSNNQIVVAQEDFLFSVDLNGRNKQQLCTKCYLSGANSINPNSEQIIIERVDTVSGDRTNQRKVSVLSLKNGDEKALPITEKTFTTPVYTFNKRGDEVVFAYTPVGNADTAKTGSSSALINNLFNELGENRSYKVVKWKPETGFTQNLAVNLNKVSSIRFSPDQNKLMLVGSTNNKTDNYIVVGKSDGSGFREFGSRVCGSTPYRASWSPDSNWITYSSCSGEIKVVSSDGRDDFIIADNGRDPEWSSSMR